MLRHPCIVKYLGWTKSEDDHWLITEPVTPLESQLDSLTPHEVCAGLYDTLQALSFLHDRVKNTFTFVSTFLYFELEVCWCVYSLPNSDQKQGRYCHNNVSLSTIFITQDGSWKLGCMEHACRSVSRELCQKRKHWRFGQKGHGASLPASPGTGGGGICQRGWVTSVVVGVTS